MTEVVFRVTDVETTGMEATDEVIEIGLTDLLWNVEAKSYTVGAPWSTLFGSTEPLKPEVMAIHHITDAQIAPLPKCDLSDIEITVTGAGDFGVPKFIVAHNFAFEAQWFTPEILGAVRAICTYKSALRLWPDAPGHSNQTLRYWLGMNLIEALAMPPHRAAPDSYVTACILGRMLQETSVKQLVAWTMMPRFYAVCPLAKHKGAKWSDVPAGYMEWMLKQPDMEADLKAAALGELQRRRGEPA